MKTTKLSEFYEFVFGRTDDCYNCECGEDGKY